MSDQSIVLRDMQPHEANMLYEIAKQSFSPLEAMGASKPKQAIVAMAGDAVAGAVFMKEFTAKDGTKTGYLDLGFVVQEHRGKGIGNRLYGAAIDRLTESGCTTLSAMVKDDNVASFGLLQRRGFMTCGFLEFLSIFGLQLGLTIWLRTMFCIACGMQFWTNHQTKPKQCIPEMILFVGLNTLFVALRQCLDVLAGGVFWPGALLSSVFVLCFVIITGYLGTLLSKEKWHFRMPRGGLLLSFAIALMGSFFPLLGRWYPAKLELSEKQKRDLGVESVVSWVSLLLLIIVSSLLGASHAFWMYTARSVFVLLLFRMVPIYPFEHMGGKRVLDWNRTVFAVLTVVTLGCFVLI